MTARGRVVDPEVLDDLAPADPRAVRSRRDLQRVNRVMGSCGILTRTLRDVLGSLPPHAPLRILELGAGDGSLALRIAARVASSWPSAELTLLDRQALIGEATGTAFAHLGWTLRPHQGRARAAPSGAALPEPAPTFHTTPMNDHPLPLPARVPGTMALQEANALAS